MRCSGELRAGPNVQKYKRKDNATLLFRRQCPDYLLFSTKLFIFLTNIQIVSSLPDQTAGKSSQSICLAEDIDKILINNI